MANEFEINSLFGGMADATPSGARYPYLTAGTYTVDIDTCRMIDTREKGIAVIVEMQVVESVNPAHPVGAMRSWYIGLNTPDKKKLGLGNIKNMVCALVGANYADPAWKAAIDAHAEAWFRAICSAANPLNGGRASVDCVDSPMRARPGQPPQDFTRHTWRTAEAGPNLEMGKILEAGAKAPPIAIAAAYQGPVPTPYGTPAANPYAAPAVAAVAPPPPAPQLSPDGRFYWTGAAWAPVPGR